MFGFGTWTLGVRNYIKCMIMLHVIMFKLLNKPINKSNDTLVLNINILDKLFCFFLQFFIINFSIVTPLLL